MFELRKRSGARVRQLRLDRGLTQEALGERASLSYKFIGEVSLENVLIRKTAVRRPRRPPTAMARAGRPAR